jgi:hypothetical protein
MEASSPQTTHSPGAEEGAEVDEEDIGETVELLSDRERWTE